MADTVVSVNKLTATDNAAAVEKKIADLVAAFYSGPDWVRQGPNFTKNRVTGEVINLNQEAVKQLDSEGPRNDAVAVVESEDGSRSYVFIEQEAVKAAGNNMAVLKRNLQAVLSEASQIPTWVWVAGIGGIALVVMTRKKRGRR